jgi:2-polyprenyl-3-methyl-5-hydroxy-6-metoxy-1,4-benzoquinol methylase
MSESSLPTATLEERNAAVRDRWNAKAEYWDEHMADGNQFQRELIGPALERLLQLQSGERVLDVACGNGVNARWMARLGADVLGIDFSRVFLERAAARKTSWDERITYQELDATDEAALLALGEGTFNAIIASMALMDMAEIGPLLRASRRLLAPEGRFVFSVQHPPFNNNSIALMGERPAADISAYFVKVGAYLTVPPGLAAGMPGEPTPHWYFHRPLHELFGEFFAAGWVIDGLEEPRFATVSEDPHRLTWSNMPDSPPVLVARAIPRSAI